MKSEYLDDLREAYENEDYLALGAFSLLAPALLSIELFGMVIGKTLEKLKEKEDWEE